jgi:hypothetical protein
LEITVSARELARYILDLVGVQEVRLDKGGTAREGDYKFFYGKGIKIINWEQDFCIPQNVSALKMVELVSYRVSYIILRVLCCNVIVLNVSDWSYILCLSNTSGKMGVN